MTEHERERYSRQILFEGIGTSGQEKLLRSRAAVVGCGALGTFHAMALARSGVGHLTIVDRDYIEPSNLQRQWLFTERDAAEGLPKAKAAEAQIAAVNSGIDVRAIVADVTPGNVAEILEGADVILDGTDNFETRYLINDFAVDRGVPWIYGAAVGSYGITMPIVPERTCCLRCVYPNQPGAGQPTCETAGVLGSTTATIAALQAAAALKVLVGEMPAELITTVDVWDGRIRQIAQPARDPECPACGLRRFEYLCGERSAPISLCGRNAVQIHERHRPVDLQGLASRLSALGQVRVNEFALRFFQAEFEITVFPDGRAIVKGTSDPDVARSLYARFVG